MKATMMVISSMTLAARVRERRKSAYNQTPIDMMLCHYCRLLWGSDETQQAKNPIKLFRGTRLTFFWQLATPMAKSTSQMLPWTLHWKSKKMGRRSIGMDTISKVVTGTTADGATGRAEKLNTTEI